MLSLFIKKKLVEVDKQTAAARKKEIQLKMKQTFNLNIGIPLPDGGNTDDGYRGWVALKACCYYK